MDLNILIPILTVVLPLIGAAVGYLFKHNIERKKELLSEVTNERRQLYQKFVDLIIDIFRNTKTGTEESQESNIEKLFGFYKKYVLYASPGVINAFSNYFQYLYQQDGELESVSIKENFMKLTNILIEMRKDLGLSNKKLGTNGERLFRALITDYDKIMK